MAALGQFAEVWCVDFEFIAQPGERPDPVCMVAQELRSGRVVRVWDEALRSMPTAPFDLGPSALYVAYSAPAELTCHVALGWPLPANVLDAYVEFRNHTNGRSQLITSRGNSLLGALAVFGLAGMSTEEKTHWRDLILRGRPYTDAEAAGILEYCYGDVAALATLLPRLVGRLEGRPHWLAHALLRGRYMAAVARMEHTGVPIDTEHFAAIAGEWEPIKAALIDRIRAEYPIFEGTTLKHDRFEAWLTSKGIAWPRTETGRLSLSEDTFRVMTRAYPVVAPIREVRDNLAKLRLTDLCVGHDGRNRAPLFPFGTRTGRNAPSTNKFIFGPSAWLRSLIRPSPGHALAYIDWSSQEIAVAAALSGDEAMQRAYRSGDPYLAFAIEAGLAPSAATKSTHKAVRDRCKAVVLGTLYGMQAESLAAQLNMTPLEARQLLQAHRRLYGRFWAWSQAAVDAAVLQGHIDTTFGWRLHAEATTKATSLLNHPMQANAAEMLRLACVFATEAGIAVCCPIHDALLIEAPVGEIEAAVAKTRALMAEASRIVLDGFEVRTEVEIVCHPDRYRDEQGAQMWDLVCGLIDHRQAA